MARKSVQAAFERAGLAADDAHDAALIASELVANSVRHASPLPSGHLAVDWSLDADGYLISVTDGGGQHDIELRATDGSDVSGRGLMIIDALAQSWGVSDGTTDRGGVSTTVWARGSFPAADALNGALQASY